MEIGVTEACSGDPHEHLSRPGLGNGDVAKLRFRLPANELDGAH
jgi:hypothetical protein